jgi:hypothetical protein
VHFISKRMFIARVLIAARPAGCAAACMAASQCQPSASAAATIMEPEPEPEPEQQAAAAPRALFRLCDLHGFARAAAVDALRRSPDGLDGALAALLISSSSGGSSSGGASALEETDGETEEMLQEELEALAAIFDDAFSRPTAQRAEIRLSREEEPALTLTLTLVASSASRYPKTPPLVALSADSLSPATNLRLTEAVAQRALELTQDDDESVKVFELCSWVTDELDASLLVDPPRAHAAQQETDAISADTAAVELARQVAAAEAERERVRRYTCGKYTYELVFGKDGSVGKVYASASAMFMRPVGARSAAHPGLEYEVGSKVEARLEHEAPFERAEVVSRRAVDGSGAVETAEKSQSELARQARQLELQRREELQRKGQGASRASTLELYANSRREGKTE